MKEKTNKVVVSLSGGLDSTILLYKMVRDFGADNVFALSFDYNQRHDIELTQARKTTERLGVKHNILDIKFMGEVAKGVSSMVKGEVETPTMEDVLGEPQPSTYMPNRNMILASITAGFAESIGANHIALGIQRIDSYSYWDTTPEFYEAIENVLSRNRKNPIKFIAPFIEMTKIGEIKLGMELGVDFGETWTCYHPLETTKGYLVCGTCPSCFERANAFKEVGISDPVADNGVLKEICVE